MPRYSYHWPRGAKNGPHRDLSFPCPVCGEGDWTLTLDADGNEVGSPTIDCEATPACEATYSEGRYGDALDAAIAAADKAEADGPSDDEWARYMAGANVGDAVHRLQEARRLK
jgi:hypothetical protein